MNFFISTPQLDAQISEIRTKIRLSMNGIVSDSMTQNGIKYKKNYGVSIPRIKEIALEYNKNHDLAQRLWNLQIRETMIMATLLEPIDKFNENLADKWVADFDQIEIVEQTAMNLFSKLDFANNLCIKWVSSTNPWINTTGFILAARIWNKLSQQEINEITKIADSLSDTENLHLYKSIALCLSRFCRVDNLIARDILNIIELYKEKNTSSHQYIHNEVKQELLFLDIL